MNSNLLSVYVDNLNVSFKTAYYIKQSIENEHYNYTPEFDSIGYICEGTGCLTVNGTELCPSAGDLYLLPAKTLQSYYSYDENPYNKYYCHFYANSGGANFFDTIKTPLCIKAKDCKRVIEVFDEMCSLNLRDNPLYTVRLKSLVMQLVYIYLIDSGNIEINYLKAEKQKSIETALKYIDENLDKDLTVDALAKSLFFNTAHFTRVFKEITGHSPKQYILQRRIQKAVNLLLSTSLNISEISDITGFKNQFYFSNAFKKINGITPSEFRKITKV